MADVFSNLTPNEFKILAAAWVSYDVPPKPDYEFIAQVCKYKNAGTASVTYGTLKRKLQAARTAAEDNGDLPASKTPTKAKRSKDAADGESQPKKRVRKTKESGIASPKTKKTSEEPPANDEDHEDGDDEAHMKIKQEANGVEADNLDHHFEDALSESEVAT